VVVLAKAQYPTALLYLPVVLALNALAPNPVLNPPLVLLLNAQKPTAVLYVPAVLQNKAIITYSYVVCYLLY
jgi:hypothetical protein